MAASVVISLAEIAYKFNISQSHLSEIFKKYTGDNFKNYVNRKIKGMDEEELISYDAAASK